VVYLDNKILLPVMILLVLTIAIPFQYAFAQPTEIWFWNSQDVIDDDPTITSTTATDDIQCFISTTLTIGKCYIFKSFNAIDVSGLEVTTTWSATVSGIQTGENRIDVRDGFYSLGDTDFPQNSTFPVSKGNGLLLRAFESTGGDGSVAQRTDIFNMPFANQSSTGFMTIFFELDDDDDFPNNNSQTHLNNFTIADFGSWKFGSDEGSVARTGNFASDGCTEGCGDFTGHGVVNLIPDTTPPVISAISGQDLIILNEGQGFFVFNFVQCIDGVDGTIPNGANFTITTAGNIDPDVVGLQTESFTCTDSATNNALADIDFLVKRASSGGGGLADTTASSIPPPLFTPSEEPISEVDRAISLFDQLNSFFDFRTPEPTPDVPTVAPVTPDTTTEPDQRDSFVDRIRDFFSGLFG